jgi:hypothetical protein
MLQGAAHCRDSGINLSDARMHEPRVGSGYCADFIDARIKVHCGEHRMNERSEPASAWSLGVST